jgi:hypothetical protein
MPIKPANRRYYGSLWRKARAHVLAQRQACEVCHKAPPEIPWLTVHHLDRDPRNNDESNLQVLCPRHHFQAEAEIQRSGLKKYVSQLPF